MQIDTERWKPMVEVIQFFPFTRGWLYELIAKGMIKTIQPWRKPMLVDMKDVKKFAAQQKEPQNETKTIRGRQRPSKH